MDAKRHYETLFDAAAGVHAFAAQTNEELRDWQQRFRPELRRLLRLGERVWDMSRLLDWALSNLDVDARRIAITGNSGGGTVSLFAAACETRIKLALPGSYFNTFAGSIGSLFQCDCNYVPVILQLGEMYDVAGLIAPRPFCAIAGAKDPIFPISHARFAYDRLRRVYEVAGNPDDCRLYVGDGGHRYFKDGAWPFVRETFELM